MEIYRCTIHLAHCGIKIISNWNTSKYWAKQQALEQVKDSKIGHISYDTYIVKDGNENSDCSKSTISPDKLKL